MKAPIINGTYEITGAKPGTYKVIIEAKPPYQNAAKDGVLVNDGQTSDAGKPEWLFCKSKNLKSLTINS